jgi:hypothetical protein
MTTLTDTQVITASGGLVELGYSEITSGVTISSTTAGSGTTIFSDLSFVSDGSPILVELFSPQARPSLSADASITVSLYLDGSEQTRTWGRHRTAAGTNGDSKPLNLSRRITPSAGSHTVSVKAYASTGSGSFGAGTGTSTTDAPAFLRVSKIVQATQWPAVTTGTIICTSSTRPASPFEGQTIYETDTDLSLTWSGSAWVEYRNYADSEASILTAAASGTGATLPGSGNYVGQIFIRTTAYGKEGFRWNGSAWARFSDTRTVLVAATTNYSQNTGYVTWNQASVNSGSLYNGSNGAFTAPYAGYYQVTAMGMANGNGYGLYDIHKNGGRYYPYFRGYAQNNNGHHHFTVNGIVYCSVSDYIQIYYEGTIVRYGDGNGYGSMNIVFVGD